MHFYFFRLFEFSLHSTIIVLAIFYFIEYIDSIDRYSLIDSKTIYKPVLLYFEKWGSRRNDSQHVKLLTEYRLYTYYNNKKYYLDKGGLINDFIILELRSIESKNTVKGSLHI